MQKMPVLFIAHGSPMLAVDESMAAPYRLWGQKLIKPKAILVFSAHWETAQLSFGELTAHDQLVYDFYGFPDELYDLAYPAPGAAELAERIAEILDGDYSLSKTERGLDHGVWVPLMHLWPQADVPVLQMTMPQNFTDQQLYELGQKLSVLREQGVMIIGSGVLTHNLGEIYWHHQGPPLEWAAAFDEWVKTALLEKRTEDLINWHTAAPFAQRNHPTPEHFRPLLIAAGAAQGGAVSFPIEGFQYGSLSERCVLFA